MGGSCNRFDTRFNGSWCGAFPESQTAREMKAKKKAAHQRRPF
jgi:hypothetical protein